jgi:hypothetical protein
LGLILEEVNASSVRPKLAFCFPSLNESSRFPELLLFRFDAKASSPELPPVNLDFEVEKLLFGSSLVLFFLLLLNESGVVPLGEDFRLEEKSPPDGLNTPPG